MKIAICDDEKIIRAQLIVSLKKYAKDRGYNFLFYEYADGKELLAAKYVFDLIFVDFMMNEINGMKAISELRKRFDKTAVIFFSGYKEVVFETLKVQPFRFLVKPIDENKLKEALDSFINDKNKEKQMLLYEEFGYRPFRISEEVIVYAEAQAVTTRVITNTQVKAYRYKKNLAAFEKELNSQNFFRAHRSFLVNLKFVVSYEETSIIFETGDNAQLTKRKYSEFKKAYLNYLTRKNLGYSDMPPAADHSLTVIT